MKYPAIVTKRYLFALSLPIFFSNIAIALAMAEAEGESVPLLPLKGTTPLKPLPELGGKPLPALDGGTYLTPGPF